MVIKKNVTQTLGVDSNCKNVCLITSGRGTAVCRAHGAKGGWSKFITTIFLHPSCPQIVLTPSYENGYCLLVLMAWENSEVNGVIAQRMDKFHSYAMPEHARTRSKVTLYPWHQRAVRHWKLDFSVIVWSLILWRKQITKLGSWKLYIYSFLSGRMDEDAA